ncbi:MAG: RES family NAD+ phosphorylase [Firmicutes bacterium]|nr:RES family NAD+ phosphorylase [Bacillota bacterium]
MKGRVPKWLIHSRDLQKVFQAQSELYDALEPMAQHLEGLQQLYLATEMMNKANFLQTHFKHLQLSPKILSELADIQKQLDAGIVDDRINDHLTSLALTAAKIGEFSKEQSLLFTQVAELYDLGNPLRQILNSQKLRQHFEDKIVALGPRFYPDIEKGELAGQETKIVLRDSQAPEDVIELEALPGIFWVEDVLYGLNAKELFGFYNHLAKFPFLGLAHPVGQRILKALKDLNYREVEGIDLFRARVRGKGTAPFTEEEMWNPPIKDASFGRANPPGVSYLYTCDTFQGAVAEVKDSKEPITDVIHWRLVEKVKMLDLSSNDSELVRFCNFVSGRGAFKPDYLVPTFLAQCIALNEIPLLKLPNVRCTGTINYIFVFHERSWFETVGHQVDV